MSSEIEMSDIHLQESKPISAWVDHVFYINLDRRPDRKLYIESQFSTMGINEYERFAAVDRPGQGIVGCGYSHLAVLKLARERQYKNVLIFEDDFTFMVSPEHFGSALSAFFGSPASADYDVCMLSYNLHESEDNLERDRVGIFRVLYAQTASGYLVHSRHYDALIALYEWAIPLLEKTGQHWVYANDVIWRSLQQNGKWYGFSPRIGKQIDGFSDNANCYMNYNC